MEHFLYGIDATLPAPATGGTAGSWFRYYKWDAQGELFVPVLPEDTGVGALVRPGDRLVFLLKPDPDTVQIYGWVPVFRVDESPTTGTLELWYRSEERRSLLEKNLAGLVAFPGHIRLAQTFFEVPDE